MDLDRMTINYRGMTNQYNKVGWALAHSKQQPPNLEGTGSALYNHTRRAQPSPNYLGYKVIRPLPDDSRAYKPQFGFTGKPGSSLKVPERLIMRGSTIPQQYH